jgi:hypothetical protein
MTLFTFPLDIKSLNLSIYNEFQASPILQVSKTGYYITIIPNKQYFINIFSRYRVLNT